MGLKKITGLWIGLICMVLAACPQRAQAEEFQILEEPVYIECDENTVRAMSADADAKSETPEDFYVKLRDELLKRPSAVTVAYEGDKNELASDAAEMLELVRQQDDPSTSDDSDFLIGSITKIGYSCSWTSKRAVYKFAVTYVENAKRVKKVNKAVTKFFKKAGIEDMTDAQKVKTIHDHLVNTIQYDRTLADHSTYGGLVKKKHTTVCQGYALLTYKMLTEAGIECRYVTGYAGEYHAWNMVKLNDAWYHLDTTWDDPISAKPVLAYNYFLIGQKTLEKDHTLGEKYTSIEASSKNFDISDIVKQTKLAKNAANKAIDRHTYAQYLAKLLDQSFDYDNREELDKLLYDLYKDILCSIIGRLPAKTYAALQGSDGELLGFLLDTSFEQYQELILDPSREYIVSQEGLDAALDLMYGDFWPMEIDEMSSEEVEQISSVYVYRVFKDKMNENSKKWTEKIITSVIKAMNE